MNSQKVAALFGTIIALLVIAGVVVFGPKLDKTPPTAPVVEAPKAPESSAPPVVRGPVVRDLPQ